MIVEFSGPSGAGKSTISSALLHELAGSGAKVGCIHASYPNSCREIPKLISDRSRHNWKANLYILPWTLLFILRNIGFSRFTLSKILSCDVSLEIKISILRSFVTKSGIHQYLRRKKFKEFLIVADEGLFHSMHNFLVHANIPNNNENLRRFCDLAPLPNRLILVTAPADVLKERVLKRGEFSPRIDSINELKSFIQNAHAAFEVVKASSRVNSVVCSYETSQKGSAQIASAILQGLKTIHED